MTACFIYSDLERSIAIFRTLIFHKGSVVTQLTCGGIVIEDFFANLLMNLSVKEF